MARKGQKNTTAEISDHFSLINEQQVDDITLEFFYKPHTLTLLLIVVLTALYFAFTRDEVTSKENIRDGICCAVFFFLVLSVLTFPNGPFTRPHPALWRIVFGIGVLYLLSLVFILFQSLSDVKYVIHWLYPELRGSEPDSKEYAVNCSQITMEKIWSHFDVFLFSHFFCWILKTMVVRHYGICWTMSITWEITEVAFIHLLPNFAECWWDQLILDILICNGLGIWIGMVICKKLEMRSFKWESIRNIPSTSGKIRRAVLQFTPASWTHVRWLDPTSSYMRVIAVYIMLVLWQVNGLNTFFLKHILLIPTSHSINIYRVVLISIIGAPSIRQYYCYVTDPMCKRLGTQCWVLCAIVMTETLISMKLGMEVFAQTILTNVILWLVVQESRQNDANMSTQYWPISESSQYSKVMDEQSNNLAVHQNNDLSFIYQERRNGHMKTGRVKIKKRAKSQKSGGN
uniref:Phosphatidylserine synthase n=1 Tax=Saccoglossus kowalevskii TaxID=10224 RepID=A0ABM0MUH4_SACKO|nr:PREDICTED: phosphatidylserine synthase 1-like [Saccoglossus kowalevskii]